MMRSFFSALAALCAVGCVEMPQDLPSRAHTDRIMVFDQSWRSGQGRLDVRVSVQNVNGSAAVCGSYLSTGPARAALNHKLLRKSTVSIGDTDLMTGMTYFARVDSLEMLNTTPGNCRDSGVPWSDSFMTDPASWHGSGGTYRI